VWQKLEESTRQTVNGLFFFHGQCSVVMFEFCHPLSISLFGILTLLWSVAITVTAPAVTELNQEAFSGSVSPPTDRM
jgi:hypothetical protein